MFILKNHARFIQVELRLSSEYWQQCICSICRSLCAERDCSSNTIAFSLLLVTFSLCKFLCICRIVVSTQQHTLLQDCLKHMRSKQINFYLTFFTYFFIVLVVFQIHSIPLNYCISLNYYIPKLFKLPHTKLNEKWVISNDEWQC